MKRSRLCFCNIKALSLFFIDRVDDYLGTDTRQAGELAQDFEILYQLKKNEVLARKNLSEDYRAYLLREARVHNGYFSRSNNDKDNQETIDLILREKEKLLSLETPLRFIFSKWALQEGWDNPNIFTLTKLAPSASHISKLQQIGRGLRLAVTQAGTRITKEENNFETVNLLDVVVAQDEGDFVRGIHLQKTRFFQIFYFRICLSFVLKILALIKSLFVKPIIFNKLFSLIFSWIPLTKSPSS